MRARTDNSMHITATSSCFFGGLVYQVCNGGFLVKLSSYICNLLFQNKNIVFMHLYFTMDKEIERNSFINVGRALPFFFHDKK